MNISLKTGLERILPPSLLPYSELARWNKPVGILLALYPSLWSLVLVSKGQPPLKLVFLFIVGAVVMRGAGCTYNDIIDKDFDAKVERTRTRPLAAGRLGKKQAIVFFLLQLLGGFLILLQLTPQAISWGIAGAMLICIYPWLKRYTYWPQAFLGIVFNWGIFIAWTSIKPLLEVETLLLFLAAFFWTLGYDTVYAHQDKSDDILIGVKSTALKLGSKTKPFLYLCSICQLTLLTAIGFMKNLSLPYFFILVLTGFIVLWQILSLDTDDPEDCLKKFKINQWIGLILLIGFILGC